MSEQISDLSKIKLVVTDIDGTLLNSKYELSKEFYPIFQKLQSKGILFAAASGRQFYNLLNRFKDIQDEVIFVAENGSYVVYKGEEMLVVAMENEITKEQLRKAREIPNTYIVLCGKKQAYVESDHPSFISKVELYYDKFEIVEDLLKVDDDQFLKIALCDFDGSESNSYTYFKDKQDILQIKISGSIWLDISHKLANKGRAINLLQKKYNITVEQTMAFGDYLNDVEMLQQAYYSYAMENAHPDVKKVSRFIAKSNDENGVIEVLQNLLKAME